MAINTMANDVFNGNEEMAEEALSNMANNAINVNGERK